MYDFLDRLITIAMPRIRDFRGRVRQELRPKRQLRDGRERAHRLSEIDYDKVDQVWGMDIVICTTAKNTAEAKALLKHFNMPFTN